MPPPGPDKKLCGAQRPNQPKGTTCRRVAGHGTDHLGIGRCSRHGGNTPTHVANAREIQTRAACKRLGVPIDTEPGQALLEEVAMAKGAEAFYAALVEKLAKVPKAPTVTEIKGGPLDGQKRLKPGKDAVYMPTYHAGGMPTGRAEPHVLVRLWMEERKRAAEADAMVVKLGLQQRLVDRVSDDARRIAQAMITFADLTGQDPESETVRAAMQTALEAVARSSSTTAAIPGTATELPA